MKTKERFFFVFFIVFLIAPSLFMAFFHRRPFWTPRFLNHLYDAGNLFPHGVSHLSLFYLQAQAQKDGPWLTLDEREYFPISKGLGTYRTRFSRFTEIYMMQTGPLSNMAGGVLAAWFYPRYQALHPGEPPPVSFRVLRASYPVGSQGARGGWVQPLISSFPEKDIEVAYANARA